MKNLDGALEILRGVESRVQFDIFGPVDDPGYWQKCGVASRRSPPT